MKEAEYGKENVSTLSRQLKVVIPEEKIVATV